MTISAAASALLGPRLRGRRGFGQLWAATSVSLLGSQVTLLALPTVAILQLGANAAQVGVLATSGWLPMLLVSAVAGVIADRVPSRRRLLVACDLASALIVGSVPLAAVLGRLTFTQLLVVNLLAGGTAVLHFLTAQALLPSLVGREALRDGNARLESSRQAATLIGPGLAGLLIELLGAARAIVSDAVSFVLSAAFLVGVPEPARAPDKSQEPSRHFLRDLYDGGRFVFGNALLRRLALSSAIGNIGWAAGYALVFLFVYRRTTITPGQLGLILTIGGALAPVAALNAPRLVRPLGPARTLAILGMLNGAAWLVLPLALVFPARPTVAVSWALFTVSDAVWNVAMVSLRQHLTPDRMIGRMLATTMTVAMGTLPIGSLLGGLLGNAIGVVSALVVAGGVRVLSVLLLLGPRLHRAGIEPSRFGRVEGAEPSPA